MCENTCSCDADLAWSELLCGGVLWTQREIDQHILSAETAKRFRAAGSVKQSIYFATESTSRHVDSHSSSSLDTAGSMPLGCGLYGVCNGMNSPSPQPSFTGSHLRRPHHVETTREQLISILLVRFVGETFDWRRWQWYSAYNWDPMRYLHQIKLLTLFYRLLRCFHFDSSELWFELPSSGREAIRRGTSTSNGNTWPRRRSDRVSRRIEINGWFCFAWLEWPDNNYSDTTRIVSYARLAKCCPPSEPHWNVVQFRSAQQYIAWNSLITNVSPFSLTQVCFFYRNFDPHASWTKRTKCSWIRHHFKWIKHIWLHEVGNSRLRFFCRTVPLRRKLGIIMFAYKEETLLIILSCDTSVFFLVISIHFFAVLRQGCSISYAYKPAMYVIVSGVHSVHSARFDRPRPCVRSWRLYPSWGAKNVASSCTSRKCC